MAPLVRFGWPPPRDAAVVEVSRVAPGRELVYRGAGTRAIDRGLKNRVRYRYRVTAIDRAGNRGSTVARWVFAVFGKGGGQDGRLLGKRTFTITR